jgi:hypothetical protein
MLTRSDYHALEFKLDNLDGECPEKRPCIGVYGL